MTSTQPIGYNYHYVYIKHNGDLGVCCQWTRRYTSFLVFSALAHTSHPGPLLLLAMFGCQCQFTSSILTLMLFRDGRCWGVRGVPSAAYLSLVGGACTNKCPCGLVLSRAAYLMRFDQVMHNWVHLLACCYDTMTVQPPLPPTHTHWKKDHAVDSWLELMRDTIFIAWLIEMTCTYMVCIVVCIIQLYHYTVC